MGPGELYSSQFQHFASVLRQRPQATAVIMGNINHPYIYGNVKFYQTGYGVLVAAEIFGLPSSENVCEYPVFGFHIHEGRQCRGTKEDFFEDALMHYNPQRCPHPFHSGDMPPLFGSHGYAYMVFMTDRFTVEEIIGRTVIVHSEADDFRTQPSGEAGEKIACGEIEKVQYSSRMW